MLSILLPFAVENDPWYMHLGQQHRCWELFNVARTQDLDVLGVPRARRKRRRQSKQVRTSLCPLELDGHSGKTEQTARYMVPNLYNIKSYDCLVPQQDHSRLFASTRTDLVRVMRSLLWAYMCHTGRAVTRSKAAKRKTDGSKLVPRLRTGIKIHMDSLGTQGRVRTYWWCLLMWRRHKEKAEARMYVCKCVCFLSGTG